MINDMKQSGVIEQYGARLRADERTAGRAYARGAVRDLRSRSISAIAKRQDVLLFIDNILPLSRRRAARFSALLGRMPSAVGYQPTLATEMGALQERITSTKKRLHHFRSGGLCSRGRPDRPRARDDRFAHLDATTVLSRNIASHGHLSRGRSAGIHEPHSLAAQVLGQEHYDVAREVHRMLAAL